MSRASWDEVWSGVAIDVSRRSRCSREKVGAVIIDRTNRVVATGYNGPPAGLPTSNGAVRSPMCDMFCERAKQGPTKLTAVSYVDCVSIHAEANALMFCDRRDREDGTIYVTSHLCWTCAKLVANSGLSRVVLVNADVSPHRRPESSYVLLRRCGLVVDAA
jgi:dCMP deaminase